MNELEKDAIILATARPAYREAILEACDYMEARTKEFEPESPLRQVIEDAIAELRDRVK